MTTGLRPMVVERTKRSLIASTSASTLNLTRANITTFRQQQSREHLYSKKGKGHVKSEVVAWITFAVTILQTMPLAHGQHSDRSDLTLQARAATSSDASDKGIHISHNLPFQLVIIIGSVILFVMFVTALACLFRSSSSRSGSKSARGSFSEGEARKKNSWSPGGANSIYAYGGESTNNSSDNLSMIKEKHNNRGSGGSALSPMPALKDQMEQNNGTHLFYSLPAMNHGQAINLPAPVAALSPRTRSNGWQLYDNPVPHPINGSRGNDVEAAESAPTRRPSFIDRLLAHRADPNDARLPNGQLASVESIAVPRIPSSRKVSAGSAILSVLNPLRSRDFSQKRLTVVESDFEGSIGGRDGEIPMAKRIQSSQGRFAFDELTIPAASPVAHRQSVDRFSPLPQRFFSARQATPHTPGLAGVGATWNQIDVIPIKNDNHGRVPTFAELQRQSVSLADAHRWKMQTTIDQWVEGSRFAGMPPPSRRGSSASFLTIGAASQFTTTSKYTDEANGLDRVPSIRPHFAATTTLASWLNADEQIIAEQSEGEEQKRADGIVEDYLVSGKLASPDANFNQKKRMLWETENGESVARPPSYHSQIITLPSSSSVDGTMGHIQGENINNRFLDEQKRRQKYLVKEKRRAEKRAIRQHSRQVEEGGNMEQQQDFILNMDESREQHLRNFPDPDEIVAQSRRSSTRIIISNRSGNRMTPMSPPESPLTSASEGPCNTPRRRSEHFLVPSSRSRSSINSGSQRSVSHSVVPSSQQYPNDHLINGSRRPVKKQSNGQTTMRSVSERPPIM